MKQKTKALAPQATVQMCQFAVLKNRAVARSLSENVKITASAAALAFSRLTAAEQIRLCAEARELHASAKA